MWILLQIIFPTLDLKRHIKRIHEGHKDYKCDSCGKSFSVADDLKTHMNIHIINKGRRD